MSRRKYKIKRVRNKEKQNDLFPMHMDDTHTHHHLHPNHGTTEDGEERRRQSRKHALYQ
jgi:hypothetical protein